MSRPVNGLTTVALCLLWAVFALAVTGRTSTSPLATCSPVNITQASWAVNGTLSSIEWVKDVNGSATTTGFLLLSDGTVFRTTDAGKTISNVRAQLNYDSIRAIYQTADGSKLFFVSNGAWVWSTEDQGATFQNSSVPYYIHDMTPHPSVASRILMTGMTPCCQQSLACTTCKALLLVSIDSGVNWSVVTDYLYYRGYLAYAWAPVLTSTIDRGLAYVAYSDKEGDQRVKLGESMNLVILSDFANPSSVISTIANGGPISISDSYAYMMAHVATGRPGLQIIEVSRNLGQNFSTVKFPPVSSFDSLREWLPTESGNPFLGVFNGRDYTYGVVYVSTGGTNSFTISLRGLIRRLNQHHWTHIGASIPGTYIANAYLTSDALTIGTFISHDHGGAWDKLMFDNGENKRRRKEKKLYQDKDDSDDDSDMNRIHLAAPFPGSKFQAPPSTPGLIIAAGQIGPTLSDWNGNTVLISRDGGRSWIQSPLNGSFVVHAVSGGSLIFAASDMNYTDTIYYSLDFGKTWSAYCFTQNGVKVKAIQFTSTDSQELATIVYLDALSEDGTSHVLYVLDTINMWSRRCTAADFVTWELENAAGDNCVFGRQNLYTRRSLSSQCLKEPGQARLLQSVPCMCTASDYICPFCYARNDEGLCDYLWSDCTDQRPVAPVNCSGTWEDPMNAAYIKNPESMCFGGVSMDNLRSILSCPPPPSIVTEPPPISTLQNDVLTTIGAISIAMCGIVIVGLYFGCRNIIAGHPPIDFNAWKIAQPPATDGDLRREKVQQDLQYQSDIEGSHAPERTDSPVTLQPLDLDSSVEMQNYDSLA